MYLETVDSDTMASDPDQGLPPPPQPGVNGVRYGAKTGYLYYTVSAQHVFMRVPVDQTSLDPAGGPEFVAASPKLREFLEWSGNGSRAAIPYRFRESILCG